LTSEPWDRARMKNPIEAGEQQILIRREI
jgi:hypothetical protein